QEAAALVDKVLELDPNSPEAGRVRKEIDDALRDRQLRQQREQEIRQALDRAQQSENRGAFEKAIEYADQVLKLDPAERRALDIRQRSVQKIEAKKKQDELERQRVERAQQVAGLIEKARRAIEAQSFDQALQALQQASA